MRRTSKRKGRQPSPKHRHKPDPEAERVGARVRLLRKEKGFDFDAFTEELGLGRGYLSELERGLVVPSLTALKKVADALEVTVSDVVLGGSIREQLFDDARRLADTDVRKLLQAAK